jgi:hypothetical protein
LRKIKLNYSIATVLFICHLAWIFVKPSLWIHMSVIDYTCTDIHTKCLYF